MGLKRVYGYHDEMAAFMALAYADIGGWPPVGSPVLPSAVASARILNKCHHLRKANAR